MRPTTEAEPVTPEARLAAADDAAKPAQTAEASEAHPGLPRHLVDMADALRAAGTQPLPRRR
jgi:hypothetical protein